MLLHLGSISYAHHMLMPHEATASPPLLVHHAATRCGPWPRTGHLSAIYRRHHDAYAWQPRAADALLYDGAQRSRRDNTFIFARPRMPESIRFVCYLIMRSMIITPRGVMKDLVAPVEQCLRRAAHADSISESKYRAPPMLTHAVVICPRPFCARRRNC